MTTKNIEITKRAKASSDQADVLGDFNNLSKIVLNGSKQVQKLAIESINSVTIMKNGAIYRIDSEGNEELVSNEHSNATEFTPLKVTAS